jgi:hypothetical protein
MADARPTPPRPGVPLRDRLAQQARAAPSGGRAKWIVWAIVGGTVFVVGILQILNPSNSPVARKVLEGHQERERQEQEKRAKDSAPMPAPVDPAAMDQGTTK